jgi:hypothetical protein
LDLFQDKSHLLPFSPSQWLALWSKHHLHFLDKLNSLLIGFYSWCLLTNST